MLTDTEQKIKNELIRRAKTGDDKVALIGYKDIAEKFDIPFGNFYERNLLFEMLDHINRHEQEVSPKRPLLSVLVVNQDFIPGSGFFNLAKKLHKQKPDEDNDVFYARALKAVFDHWVNI